MRGDMQATEKRLKDIMAGKKSPSSAASLATRKKASAASGAGGANNRGHIQVFQVRSYPLGEYSLRSGPDHTPLRRSYSTALICTQIFLICCRSRYMLKEYGRWLNV